MDDPKSHISVTGPALSGYFAVLYWWNPEHEGFWEPYNTGVGRYATREEAVEEAKEWAEAEGLEYRDG